jgi:hypothetical protein
MKAMSTFLNATGPTDYNLPKLTGERISVSNKVNMPSWGMQSRTKMSWFPGRHVDFQGSSSPPATVYSPKPDRDYRNQKYSVPGSSRFYIPSSKMKLHKQIPHQYTTLSVGFDPKTGPKNYSTNKVAIGYGSKSDFTNAKELNQIPGPIYDQHTINSISYQSAK